MNSQHNNGNDDRSLDHDLNQLDQLYHSGESIEPPDMIDQAVLNKARLAVKPKNGWLDFGWIHGLTTVALVVLTFSILTTQRETGEFEPAVHKSLDRTTSEMSGQISEVTDQSIDVRLESTGQSVEVTAQSKEVTGQLTGRADQAVQSTANQAKSRRKTEADMTAADQAADQTAASAGVAPAAPKPVQPALQSPEPLNEEIQQGSRARDEDRAQRQMPAPASVAPAQTAEKKIAAKDQLKSFDKLDSTAESEAFSVTGPQQMLDQIMALKQVGDDRWIEELSNFKKLYPDIPLPVDLQDKD